MKKSYGSLDNQIQLFQIIFDNFDLVNFSKSDRNIL